MGHRLSRIYTRTGDSGTTGLGDGSRVEKNCPRVEAIGTVDELNSAIGVVLSQDPDPQVQTCLLDIQHDLFDLGGELCIPGTASLTDEHVTGLEQQLDAFNAELEPLKEFVLPGGGPAASFCHLARTTARRAERRVITLASQEAVSPVAVRYLNRLSDLLFVIARRSAIASGQGEQLWDKNRRG